MTSSIRKGPSGPFIDGTNVGDILVWNGEDWVPSAPASGGVLVATAQLDEDLTSGYTTTAPYPGNEYIAVSGNTFSLEPDSEGRFSLTAEGCILTYSGPNVRVLASLVQTVLPDAASGEHFYAIGIAKNGDLIGTATYGNTQSSRGIESVEYSGIVSASALSCARDVTLADGDTLQPVLSKVVVDSANLDLRGLTLSVMVIGEV